MSRCRLVSSGVRVGLVLAPLAFLLRGPLTAAEVPLRILVGHSDLVASVAFSPDGKTLASGSKDKTITLWEVPNSVGGAATPRSPVGHTAFVSSVAFSPDDRSLALASGAETILVWNVGEVTRPD